MAEHPEVRGFGRDAATCAALRGGLAGLNVRVDRGTFREMIETIAREPGPKALLADLEGAGAPAVEATRILRGITHPDTHLIVVTPDRAAQSVRACYRAGAADYLTKPLSAALAREAATAVLVDPDTPPRPHAGRVVVCGGTAGVGLSSLVLAIARGIAESARTVLCVDLDPVAGRARSLTGTQPNRALDATLFRLEAELQLKEEEEADEEGGGGEPEDAPLRTEVNARLATPVQPGLGLVAYPAPDGPLEEPPTSRSVRRLLDGLANHAQVVLVIGLSEPDVQITAFEAADAKLVAYEPTLASIGYATHLLALLDDPRDATLVQCHPRGPRSALTPREITRALAGRRPDAVIPYDPALRAQESGRSFRGPGKRYVRGVNTVITAAIGAPVERLDRRLRTGSGRG